MRGMAPECYYLGREGWLAHQRFGTGSQDRPVSIPVPREGGCLSGPLREPQDRPRRVRPGVRQRVGAWDLQRQPRMHGNTVFLDDQLKPHADQWAFLASARLITKAQCEAVVREADSKGRILGVRAALTLEGDEDTPWAAPPSRRHKEPPVSGPLPESLELVLSDQVYISKEPLPRALRNRLVRLAAFQNPEFYRAQAMRLPVYDRPRIIHCAEVLPHHLGLPRGCLVRRCNVPSIIYADFFCICGLACSPAWSSAAAPYRFSVW
jgi:hypothetical protein